MAGFLAAAEAAGAPSVRTLAYYCAAATGWGGLPDYGLFRFLDLLPYVYLARGGVEQMSQAEAD
jgi:hypothetical protein